MKFRDELKWIVPIVAVCFLVFGNTLVGDFVYDDSRQILRNALIHDNSLIWKALTSDVWAFKGDGSVAASNYWRPTFTAWHIINFRLFGTNPFGWHFSNLLLHSGVCVLSYALLRRWSFSAAAAFTVSLLFAIHPIHVESVAWISGSPDMLFALAFLGSLWFVQDYAEGSQTRSLVLTVILYAIALGAKEIGIVCLPVFYFVLSDGVAKKKPQSANTPLFLLAATAAVYFIARWVILGAFSRPPEDAIRLSEAILSVPLMFVFYLRQIFFPYWLGANYPLEPVTQIGLLNFIIPALVSLAALAGMYFLSKKLTSGKLAVALFLLPLVTAMNATAFTPEQMVHDRYLYLPLLGVLMLVVAFAARFITERNLLIVGLGLSVVLAIPAFLYNSAWASELSLWAWTTTVDNSAFTSMQHANALTAAGRNNEAIEAFSQAIERKPTMRGFLGRARVYVSAKQLQQAENDLNRALQFPPEKIEAYALYQVYESLGIVYVEQGRFDAAAKSFRDARVKLPIYAAALTEKLAVVLYQNGQKDVALSELESARAQARKELLPESKSIFLRLGMLYAERGQKDEARIALREYLDLTSAIKDADTLADRGQAIKIFQSL
jgi:tetratricopeptide (TPR) repeat protein